MAELESASPSPAGSGNGLASGAGLADTAPAGSFSPAAPARELATPAATRTELPTAPADSGPVDWEKRFKDTQSELTKAKQALSGLGDVDQLRTAASFVAALRQDPQFLQWASQRLTAQQAGQEQLDPETAKAIQIVRAVAQHEAQQQAAPIKAAMAQARANAIFGQMDKDFGPDWRSHMPAVAALHKENVESGRSDEHFDYKYVAALYRAARSEDPEWVAQEYQRRLSQKQANATIANPGTAPAAVGQPKPGSLREAFAQAKRQHGFA